MNLLTCYRVAVCLLAGLAGLARCGFAQTAAPDTLFCGDTLTAAFSPGQTGPVMDSFYVWLGNCDTLVRFDFTTANVPDAAEIYYVDLAGNLSNAGKIPYFGADCGNQNYFGNPGLYPLQMSMDPQYCLPGFVELYGKGIPFQDSIVRRFSLPADFQLSGYYQESARLHLRIPPGIVAVLFVVRYHPSQNTVLSALWDCSPTCCIGARGDTVCVGESIQLDTDRPALTYRWTGPGGFTSTDRAPVIPNATSANSGWYAVEGSYRFGCTGIDSVHIAVVGPEVALNTDTARICLGGAATLQASGALSYTWDLTAPGFVSANGALAQVAPQSLARYVVTGEDGFGCRDTASAVVVPLSLSLDLAATNPSCPGAMDGAIVGSIAGGSGNYEIRPVGGVWQPGNLLGQLGAGTYAVEVRDVMGCQASGTGTLSDPEAVRAYVATQDPLCHGDCDGEALVLASGGSAPYRYRMAGLEVDSLLRGLCAGKYAMQVVDAKGCTRETAFELIDPEPFVIDLGKDKKVREGDSVNLVIEANALLDLLSWPGYCEGDCGPSLTLAPDTAQMLTALAWTPEGCFATDSVWVFVRKKVKCDDGFYVPTAFSPNADGHNERFTVYADVIDGDVAEIGRLVIFNRWGKPVFDRSHFPPGDENQGWDGFAKGAPVPEGVYAWAATFIRTDGLSFECGGTVTLIR